MPEALLWLRSDTTNGDTTFEDSSDYGRTITVFGDSQHSTTKKKFNATSMYFDGTGDYLTVPDSTDFDFGTDDFTVEFWIWPDVINNYDTIIGRYNAWGDANQFYIRLHSSRGGIQFKTGTDTSVYADSLSLTQFHHIACVRSSGTNKIYLNGVEQDSASSSADISASDDLYIARTPSNTSEAYPGYIEDLIVHDYAKWTSNFTPEAGNLSSAPSPLSPTSPEIVSTAENPGRITCPSPLAAAAVSGAADYTDLLIESTVRFQMDLTTPTGAVRVPISSWQATLQTTQSNYLQCVIPACGDYLDDINTATDFTVYMTADLTNGGTIQQTMATSTLDTLAIDRGGINYTATLSGYTAGFTAQASPSTEFDRILTGIRTTSVSGTNTRVRCNIDWLLRPGHRAYLDDTDSIVASYVNYYVNASDRYMDAGERSG